MKTKWKIVAAAMVAVCCMVAFVGCGDEIKSQKVSSEKIKYARADSSVLKNADSKMAVANFSADLFRKNRKENSNSLISPLSAYLCLAMLANGANGVTLSEMENVLGMSLDNLNEYCANLYAEMCEDEQRQNYVSLSNSIWYNDLMPREEFLNVNSLYYGAEMFKTNFYDPNTIKDVNKWISQKTDGMIKEALSELDPETVSLLVNTLLFDSEWKKEGGYTERDVNFTCEGGTTNKVKGFYASTYDYYRSQNYHAFKLGYKASGISFYGILPTKDGKYGGKDVSFDSIIDGFDGNELYSLLNGYCDGYDVSAMVPCFEYDYDVKLDEYFAQNGMASAFNPFGADFSNMYDGLSYDHNVYLGFILQKTRIELTTKGTKAAAATIIGPKDTSAAPDERQNVQLYLDRPFIYMIVDDLSGMPLFVGSVATL